MLSLSIIRCKTSIRTLGRTTVPVSMGIEFEQWSNYCQNCSRFFKLLSISRDSVNLLADGDWTTNLALTINFSARSLSECRSMKIPRASSSAGLHLLHSLDKKCLHCAPKWNNRVSVSPLVVWAIQISFLGCFLFLLCHSLPISDEHHEKRKRKYQTKENGLRNHDFSLFKGLACIRIYDSFGYLEKYTGCRFFMWRQFWQKAGLIEQPDYKSYILPKALQKALFGK